MPCAENKAGAKTNTARNPPMAATVYKRSRVRTSICIRRKGVKRGAARGVKRGKKEDGHMKINRYETSPETNGGYQKR